MTAGLIIDDVKKTDATSALAQELFSSGAVDQLFAQINSGKIQLSGYGGLLPAMLKAALERALKAELDNHLGYVKGDLEGEQIRKLGKWFHAQNSLNRSRKGHSRYSTRSH